MRREVLQGALIAIAVSAVILLFILSVKTYGYNVHWIGRTETRDSAAVPAMKSTGVGKSDPRRSAIKDLVRYPCLPGSWRGHSLWDCVRIFNDTEPLKSSECHLVSYRTPFGQTPICTYDRKVDTYVSRNLQESGKWEGDMVSRIVDRLKDHPKMMLLDIGCNIGVYSLAAAKMGRTVVAVDAMLENLRLLNHSLALGKLQNQVTVVWNAVSDGYGEVTLKKFSDNQGMTRIEKYEEKHAEDFSTYVVNTIRLDDLIPLVDGSPVVIKLDIEGHELHALLGGMKFLDMVDVRVFQMEFVFHRNQESGKQIAEILYGKGFNAYKDSGHDTMPLKVSDCSQWPHDVYFLKLQR